MKRIVWITITFMLLAGCRRFGVDVAPTPVVPPAATGTLPPATVTAAPSPSPAALLATGTAVATRLLRVP